MNEAPQTTPWYRQFWPWFLIALPASVVIAGLTTVYIAVEGADDLVADDYYKDGLAVNRKLEARQAASDMGLQAELDFFQSNITVRLNRPVDNASLKLALSHPMEANRDQQLQLLQLDATLYSAPLPQPLVGRWHWMLTSGEGDWRLDGEVSAADARP